MPGKCGVRGAGAGQRSSGEVEKSNHYGRSFCPVQFGERDAVFGPLVQVIRSALVVAQPVAAPARAFDPEAVKVAVERLNALIEANDGDAAEAAAALADLLAGTIEDRRIRDLRASIDEFDFDGAKARLDEIAKECHLSVG